MNPYPTAAPLVVPGYLIVAGPRFQRGYGPVVAGGARFPRRVWDGTMDPYPTAVLLVVLGHLIVAGLRFSSGTDLWLRATQGLHL